MQLKNKLFMSSRFESVKLDKSIEIKELQLKNNEEISTIFFPLNELKDKLVKEIHPLNMLLISSIIKSFIYLSLKENSVI